jgi:hypothetical protein
MRLICGPLLARGQQRVRSPDSRSTEFRRGRLGRSSICAPSADHVLARAVRDLERRCMTSRRSSASLTFCGGRAGTFSASPRQRAIIYRPHALLHLARHIIVAHDRAAVAPHASRCTRNIQSAWPASITRVRRACSADAGAPARGWAASNSCNLARAASSARPIRPSAAARSWMISYSRASRGVR